MGLSKSGKAAVAAVIVVALLGGGGAAAWFLVIYPSQVREAITARYQELDSAVTSKDLDGVDEVTRELGIVDKIRGFPMADQLLDAATLTLTTEVESIEVRGDTAEATVDRHLSVSVQVPLLSLDLDREWAGVDTDTWKRIDGEWQLTESSGQALGAFMDWRL
jgi:hypothetical protein